MVAQLSTRAAPKYSLAQGQGEGGAPRRRRPTQPSKEPTPDLTKSRSPTMASRSRFSRTHLQSKAEIEAPPARAKIFSVVIRMIKVHSWSGPNPESVTWEETSCHIGCVNTVNSAMFPYPVFSSDTPYPRSFVLYHRPRLLCHCGPCPLEVPTWPSLAKHQGCQRRRLWDRNGSSCSC